MHNFEVSNDILLNDTVEYGGAICRLCSRHWKTAEELELEFEFEKKHLDLIYLSVKYLFNRDIYQIKSREKWSYFIDCYSARVLISDYYHVNNDNPLVKQIKHAFTGIDSESCYKIVEQILDILKEPNKYLNKYVQDLCEP